jgi:hypothetical protein
VKHCIVVQIILKNECTLQLEAERNEHASALDGLEGFEGFGGDTSTPSVLTGTRGGIGIDLDDHTA